MQEKGSFKAGGWHINIQNVPIYGTHKMVCDEGMYL